MADINYNCEPVGELTVDQINLPEVLQDVTTMIDKYEVALVSNDVDALVALFWGSQHTVRYGATECLYGYQEIVEFRKGRNPKGVMRTVTRRAITTYGTRFANSSLEFVRDGESRIGRQSQMWVKFAEGWRVVNAHVSWMDAPRTLD